MKFRVGDVVWYWFGNMGEWFYLGIRRVEIITLKDNVARVRILDLSQKEKEDINLRIGTVQSMPAEEFGLINAKDLFKTKAEILLKRIGGDL